MDFLKFFGLEAHRSQQYCGRGENASDVICESLPFVHFECKRVEKLNIENAMQQAIKDAKDQTPVVAHRKNRGEWLATMKLEHFLLLAKLKV